MDSPIALQEFLEYVVAQLIEHHDHASIVHELDRGKHVFRIVLDEEDVGRVIGKNGYTISAIRSLVNAAASRGQMKAVLKVEFRREPVSVGDQTDDVES